MKPLKYVPHDYQEYAIQWLMKRMVLRAEGCALFLDCGLGKTTIALSVLRLLSQMRLHKAALVVAPLRVIYSVWPAETQKFQQFEHLKCSIVHGSPTQKMIQLQKKADIYLTNPEGVQWLSHMEDYPFDTLVIDESTKFKSWKSKRSKGMRRMRESFTRSLILTGTPAPNGLQDLFSQVFLADQGKALGKRESLFHKRYFHKGGFGGHTLILNDNAEPLIHKRIEPMCLRMSADEYLDLPDLLENDVLVQMPPDAKSRYDELEKEMFMLLDGLQLECLEPDTESEDAQGNLDPDGGGAKYMACRQVANGAVYDAEDKTKYLDVHDAKIQAVKDIVEELHGKPALLVFQFKHDLERLRKVYKGLKSIDSSTSGPEGDELVKKWNAGELDLLAVQPQSLSHGVNLQSGPGRDIIWIGLTDRLEDYLQLIARIHRQGVTGQVRVHRILSEGTVDEAILQRTTQKTRTQESLLEALREYRKRKESSDA